jgi:hypothetical protein
MRASDVANDGSGTTVPETTSAPSTPRAAPKLDPRKFNVNAGGSSTASTGSSQRRAVDNPVVAVILVLLALALGYLLLVLALPFGRRARARRRAVTPSQRIALAWTETAEAVARSGSSPPYSSETHHEYASRVALALGPVAGDLRQLAGMVSESSWSGTEPAPATVDAAEALGRSIRRDLAHRTTIRDRALARLDPHRLLRAKPPARPRAPDTSVRDREPVSR